MNDFNFLPPKKVVDEGEIKQKKAIWSKALLILILTGVAAAVTWGYSLYQGFRIAALKTRKSDLENEIVSQQNKIDLVSRVHHKASGIKYILDSQFDYGTGFKIFFQILPSGVSASEINIGKTGDLKASLAASSSGALKDFVSQLTNPSRGYENVFFEQVRSEKDGAYSLNMGLKVGSKK